MIALRFEDDAFLTVLDNYENNEDKPWYDKLHDDEIPPFEIETFEFDFNNIEYVNEVTGLYKNKTILNDFENDEPVFTVKYILAAKCNDVGFVVGGNNMEIVTHNGILSEEDIEKANKKWWEYWKDYWKLRGSKDAYEKDFACEVCIPVEHKN